MHWQLFALISVISFSAASLFQRLIMKEKDSDPITSTVLVQTLLGILSGAFAIYTGFHVPPINLWMLFLVSGCLYAFGTLFFFKAAKLMEASEITILTGLGTIVPIIVSFIFLAERLTPIQLLGSTIIIFAVVMVQYERKRINFNQGAKYALLATTCYGIAVVIDGAILRSFDTFSFLPIVFFLTSAILLITYPRKFPKVIAEAKKLNTKVLAYSLVYVTAAETFYIPLKNGALVSQMTTIMRASIILTVILAMIFLGERSHKWKKLIGAVLTTIGVLLIR